MEVLQTELCVSQIQTLKSLSPGLQMWQCLEIISLKRWLLWNDVILWALSQSEWDPYKKGNFWMLMCTHAERPYEYRDKMVDSLREICQKG